MSELIGNEQVTSGNIDTKMAPPIASAILPRSIRVSARSGFPAITSSRFGIPFNDNSGQRRLALPAYLRALYRGAAAGPCLVQVLDGGQAFGANPFDPSQH